MKHKSILFCLLFVLLFAVPWKATASSTHLMGTITIYVDEQKTIYRDSKYIPSNYYVSDDGWFIRQKTGNAWSDGQEFYDVKIISKNSQSCTILGLQSNYDAYGLTTTELHCKGTRQSIGEYEEMVWKIEVKSYGSLRVEASPAGGTVDAGTKVTLTATSNGNTVSGCDIYYTLDGSTPTKSSTKYTSSGVTIAQSCWLNAKAFKTGYESFHIDEWYYYVSPVIAEVNETNFPDENFRNWILAQDYGKDGKLTQDEIKGVTRIGVSGTSDSPDNIKSLKGIEYFTALTTLYCHYNQLTSLDVSKNTKLKWLSCYHNKISNLNLSNNTELLQLVCNDNQLTTLDLSNNVSLTSLDCYGNQLTTLDVSKNTALSLLSCYNNNLTALDVSKNTALTYLSCYNNNLTALDVSKNTALNTLYCQNNKLNSLDLSSNTALTFINCFGNGISTIDVSKNINLETLACQANNLTTLDVSNNKKINWLLIHHNKIKGSAMDNLIASLPVNTTEERYTFFVVSDDDVLSGIQLEPEGNVCTKAQVAALKAKGWTATKNGGEYEGSEEVLYDKGDVNMDNAVNGTDLVALSNIVLGRKEKTESADVNGDGSVNGTDIVALSNIILGRSSNAPRRAGEAGTGLSIEPFDILAGEEKEMLIDLSNPNDEITLVQFDLHLPEGLSIKKSGTDLDIDMGNRTSWRKHTLDANETDGGYRFLLYSSSNTVIEGTSGAVIKVKVVADASFKGGKIVIDNTLLVSPDEKETKPEAYEYAFPTVDDGSAKLAIEPFNIKAGEEKEMLIDLSNPNDEVTLVQFDLHLPEGLSIKKNGADLVYDMADRTSWRKHTLDANETDGGYRFLLYSSSNTVIDGTSGAVIKVTLVASQDMSGKKIILDNILLVSPDEKETKPARYEYVIGTETGIRNITLDSQADTPIYNLRGQRLAAPQKGINIIGGKKVVVK